jgi:hypothetical protein
LDRPFPAYVIRFDMALCALFAVPGLSGLVLTALDRLNASLGLGGEIGILESTAHFFVNFAGVLGVLLNYVLFRSRDKRSHWANVAARGAVSALICGYVLAGSLPSLFLLFVATEVGGAILTLTWLRQSNSETIK